MVVLPFSVSGFLELDGLDVTPLFTGEIVATAILPEPSTAIWRRAALAWRPVSGVCGPRRFEREPDGGDCVILSRPRFLQADGFARSLLDHHSLACVHEKAKR